MNAVWFQYLVDPSYRVPHRLVKRAIDLLGALALGTLALPLCALFVLLVRRDGGPGIFRQARIGEAGQQFTLYKLRTMHPSSGQAAQWASINDPRVTPIGSVLRRTHLDELPQLLNVLRGEMSLVGPRPEQPAVVERLERDVPFYQRRHLIRPGISGWAQIRCGYARSDSGSAWKHCHDLYYLKNRSVGLDLLILAVTARLVVRSAIRRTEAVASGGVSSRDRGLARAGRTGGGSAGPTRQTPGNTDIAAPMPSPPRSVRCATRARSLASPTNGTGSSRRWRDRARFCVTAGCSSGGATTGSGRCSRST